MYADDTETGRGAFVENSGGLTFRLRFSAQEGLGLEEMGRAPAAERRTGMLLDGIVTAGTRNIAAAWLVGPTSRYAHGVLGDAIEAEGVAVETAAGSRLELRLPEDSVFEDRYPRLADIDGDGDDEVLVVRSYLDRGAALAVIKIRADGLAIVAETPALGRPNRWLNPVGIGDFDGDGRIEVALVETPHIGGVLKLYRWREGGLVPAFSLSGVSNHAIGSRALALSAVLDANGDGVPDLLIPDQSRRRLLILAYAGGHLAEIAAIPHPHPIVTDIAVADLDGNGAADAVYALADGTVVALLFGR
ncbi:MAG: VCBS repeat-containing protein [Pseudomonadota bacterium]